MGMRNETNTKKNTNGFQCNSQHACKNKTKEDIEDKQTSGDNEFK